MLRLESTGLVQTILHMNNVGLRESNRQSLSQCEAVGGGRWDTGMAAHTGGTETGRSLEFMGQPASSIGEPPIAVGLCLRKPKLDGSRGSGETEGYLMQKWPNGWASQKTS